jgi:hypothetical protein
MGTQKALSWLVALVGAWEVIAVAVLGYSASSAALWDAILVGAVLVVLGIWAALSNQTGTDRALDWINVVLGVWLIIAPFLLGYSALTAALWNDIIVGIVVVVLAGWAALAMGRYHQPAA